MHAVDYNETFAPLVNFATVRLFLAHVASRGLELHQMDVKTAILNGDLTADIYMEQPQGFRNKTHPNYVCKPQKALYGLKQAPRQWSAKINNFLCEELGFSSRAYDLCLYIKGSGSSFVMLKLYGDDLLLAAKDLKNLLFIKNRLCLRFDMEDCGEAKTCLGFEIGRNRGRRMLKIVKPCMPIRFWTVLECLIRICVPLHWNVS